MLAPLRNPCFNFCILVALCAASAPMVFHCQAHPLGGDNLSIGGVPARSDTSHSRSARDQRPEYPDYEEEYADIVSDTEDEDDNDIPRFESIQSVSDIDEEAGTAKLQLLSGTKNVTLKAKPQELGENDPQGLSRKYYVIDPNHAPDELDSQGVLKIVDLLKAEKFGKEVPDFLRTEGWYWSQGEGNMFLWETDDPVEKHDSHGNIVERDYMVMYRSTRTGIPLEDENGDMHWTKLKFIGEWVLDWNSTGKTEDTLTKCKDSAMKTHKSLADKKMEINDYDLNKWVADENCNYWLPNEINVSFDTFDEGREVSVKGGDDLELERGDYEAHFQKVKEQLGQQFTPDAIETHRNKLSEIAGQA